MSDEITQAEMQPYMKMKDVPTGAVFAVYEPDGDYYKCYRRVSVCGMTMLRNDDGDEYVPVQHECEPPTAHIESISPEADVRGCDEDGTLLLTEGEQTRQTVHFEQVEHALDSISDAVREEITRRRGRQGVVVYSAWREDEHHIPQDNLQEVAVEGRAIFKGWMPEGEGYWSDVVENPTWLDLAVLADDMIRHKGDYHHRFFEGVEFEHQRDDGVKVYLLMMGS